MNPPTLPEKPLGYKMKMSAHFTMQKEYQSVYSITDPAGREMPFTYIRRTSKRNFKITEAGYDLGPDYPKLLTWDELREKWPAYLEAEKTKA